MTMVITDPYEEKIIEEILRHRDSRLRIGPHTARVESIDDPERIERVKVRIWAIHGPETRTPLEALPWAPVAQRYGGGHDFGSFSPPPVGAWVYVEFEQGIEDFPIVMGTFRGKPVRDALNPNTMLNSDGQHPDEKQWLPPDDTVETPADVYDDLHANDNHPTRTILHKTIKGHTIEFEDGDGKEQIRIIDRAGQVIELYCPVAPDAQFTSSCRAGNSAQRGGRTALRGDALPQDAMRDKKGHIRIKDIAGQEIFMDGKMGLERIRITSKDANGSSVQSIEMLSGKGKEMIRIRDKSGNKITLDPNGDSAVTIEDSSGSRLLWKPGRALEVVASSNFEETVAKNKVIGIGGSEVGIISGDSDLAIAGNLRRAIGNEWSQSTAGDGKLMIGGRLQFLANNSGALDSPTPPLPTDLALELAVGLLGRMELSTQTGDQSRNVSILGDITDHTLLGDVAYSTDIGNASLSTLFGDASVRTTAGIAELISSLGIANIDGTTVHLGPAAAAINPLIKGLPFLVSNTAYYGGLVAPLAVLTTATGVLGGALAVPPVSTTWSIAAPLIITWLTALTAFLGAWTALVGGQAAAIPTWPSTKSFTA